MSGVAVNHILPSMLHSLSSGSPLHTAGGPTEPEEEFPILGTTCPSLMLLSDDMVGMI